MQNTVFLIGRIGYEPQINEIENRKITTLTLAIQRSYRNSEGVFESDFIPITLWDGIAEYVTEYCKKGDLVGVKGRIERLGKEEAITLVADKVSFLSSKKEN